MEADLRLISSEFLYDDFFTKQQAYLLKYFRTPMQRRILAYYLSFYESHKLSPRRFYENFVDHTGISATRRSIQLWVQQYLLLDRLRKQAAEEYNLDLLELIESGNYPLAPQGARNVRNRVSKK